MVRCSSGRHNLKLLWTALSKVIIEESQKGASFGGGGSSKQRHYVISRAQPSFNVK